MKIGIIMVWIAFIITSIMIFDMFTGRCIAEFFARVISVNQVSKMTIECCQLVDKLSAYDMQGYDAGPDIDWTKSDSLLANAVAKMFVYYDILGLINISHFKFDTQSFMTPKKVLKSIDLTLGDIAYIRLASAVRLVYAHKMGKYDITEITRNQINTDSSIGYADEHNMDVIIKLGHEIGDLYEKWNRKASVETP